MGAEASPGQFVVERFQWRHAEVNPHVKSIVRAKDTLRMGSDPHTFRVTGQVLDENGLILPEEYAINYGDKGPSANYLRINHYHTKTKEEYFKRKLACPDSNSGIPYTVEKLEQTFASHNKNELTDRYLSTFVPQITKLLNTQIWQPN